MPGQFDVIILGIVSISLARAIPFTIPAISKYTRIIYMPDSEINQMLNAAE
jgi:hypothetical protein